MSWRGTSASDSEKLCGLLQWRENASVIEQGCAGLSAGSAIRRHRFARHTGRTSSSIRSDLDFRYTQVIGHRPGVQHEQPTGSPAVVGDDRGLHAELVRRGGLALADALHFRGRHACDRRIYATRCRSSPADIVQTRTSRAFATRELHRSLHLNFRSYRMFGSRSGMLTSTGFIGRKT